MADYFGLEAIAKRMQVTTTTVKTWFFDRDFPMYRRGGIGRRPMWFTCDDLIRVWEFEQSRRDRVSRLAARAHGSGLQPRLTVDKKLTTSQDSR